MSTTSLATHFTASLLLCPLGLRRLLCSSSLYLTNPSLYRSRTWYFSQSNWKTLDIYSLLILLPIASLSHIVFFLAISESPIHKFSFLQQSFVLYLFWAILILIIVKESFDLCSFLPDNLVFAFAAIAFLIEFYMAGRGLVGFGGWLYRILGYFTLLCAGCCLCLSVRPRAFFAEFLLSCGLVLKGSWVLQVGLSLYTDAFGLKGCGKIERGEADVKCELDDDVWRGVALVNLVFVGHVIVVIVIGFVSFGLLHNRKRGEGSGLGVGVMNLINSGGKEVEEAGREIEEVAGNGGEGCGDFGTAVKEAENLGKEDESLAVGGNGAKCEIDLGREVDGPNAYCG